MNEHEDSFFCSVGVVWALVAGWFAYRRAKARDQRIMAVEAAAIVAAEDDPKFDLARIIPLAQDLVVQVLTAWSSNDRGALAALVGPDLCVEWDRRLDTLERSSWWSHLEMRCPPDVRLVSIVNRSGDLDDRAVVHVRMSIDRKVEKHDPKDPPGRDSWFDARPEDESYWLAEFWTLGWHPRGHWRLISTEREREGMHHVNGPLVLTPDQDPELAARARTGLAVDDAAGDGGAVATLVSTGFRDDARAAALDLSLVDDRFSPDVLAIAVDRAVAAWAEAIDGPDDALRRLAAPEAVETLLYGPNPGSRTRIVVRGPRVTAITIESVAGHEGTAATMDVLLRFRARRYREDRDTVTPFAPLEDSPFPDPRYFEIKRSSHWRFELTDDRENPWKLTATSV